MAILAVFDNFFCHKNIAQSFHVFIKFFSAICQWIIIMNIHCIFIHIIQILDYKIYVWNFLEWLIIIFIEYRWIFERHKYSNRVWDFQSIKVHLKLNALKTPLKWLWTQMLLCELILTPVVFSDLNCYRSDVVIC